MLTNTNMVSNTNMVLMIEFADYSHIEMQYKHSAARAGKWSHIPLQGLSVRCRLCKN